MPDVCTYSLLPKRACAHCHPAPADDPPADSHTFNARYESVCDACGFSIYPGNRVRYIAGHLHHLHCH